MKKNIVAKVMAFIALAWIIISIIWTWLLIIFSSSSTNNWSETLTQEDLQKLLENSWTWNFIENIDIETSSWMIQE